MGSGLERLGVETVVGDLRDPLSLDRACLGADIVITTATAWASQQPGDSLIATDRQGQLNLVQAARAQGAQHFIYINQAGNGDAAASACPLTAAKRLVERVVLESGLTYTILRPCDFMETWLAPGTGFDFRNARATIYGEGQARVSFISVGDVAQCAVESVGNTAARNQIIELGGPAALSPLEAVRIFEKVSGQSFELQFVPAAVLKAYKEATDDPVQPSLAAARFA